VVSFTWAKRCLGKAPAGLFEPEVCSRRVIVTHAVVLDAADKDRIHALRDRGCLVIDSLDSLRVERTQRVFRDLIRLVQTQLPDWRIVASMRTFDARQSTDFHALFPTRTPSAHESVAIPARNLLVPALSDSEIEDAIRQDQRLKFVFEGASEDLQTVLRKPRHPT
jgi:hypothetical protein